MAVSGRRTPKAKTILAYVAVAVLLVFVLFPIYWMFLTSVKYPRDILSSIPIFFPSRITWEHYVNIYRLQLFPPLWNSLIASTTATVIALVLGTPAAYGFARFQFKRKRDVFFWILSTRMLPAVTLAIPLFIMMQWFRLTDTVYSLIIVYTAMNLPFAVWMMTGFFSGVPMEIEEAALIDGCGRFQTFVRIAVPMVAPGLVATMTFCFIFAWNEFLFALIFTRRVAMTLPIALAGLHATFGPEWGRIGAMALLIAIPVWILALLSQRYLVRGLTMGAVK